MHESNSLSHVRWDCNYQVVFVPKYREKQLQGKMREGMRTGLLDLSRQIGADVLEGHLMTGPHFWSRGYCVSTIGLAEETIRRYIREQEDRDQKQQRLEFE